MAGPSWTSSGSFSMSPMSVSSISLDDFGSSFKLKISKM